LPSPLPSWKLDAIVVLLTRRGADFKEMFVFATETTSVCAAGRAIG
jgi:hypothetical protein